MLTAEPALEPNLTSFNQRLLKTKTIPEALAGLMDLVGRFVAPPAWSLLLHHETFDTWEFSYVDGTGWVPGTQGARLGTTALMSWVKNNRTSMHVETSGNWGEFDAYRTSPVGSVIAAPLTTPTSFLGVLVALAPQGSVLTPLQVDRLGALGDLGAVVVDRLALEQKLDAFGETDLLTKMGNRRVFDRILGQEIQRTQRLRSLFCLVLITLHGLRSINDVHGVQMGDEVLRRFADLVRKTLRTADTAVRLGGGTFALILPGGRMALEDAHFRVQRLYQAVRRSEISLDGGRTLKLSFGATIRVVDPDRPETIFTTADRQVYLNEESAS